MLLQYNFNNSKVGQTKVNVIYSKNQTLSKVTIINGARFRINYPYNLANNLTSNVLVIQKIKFGDAQKQKSPIINQNNTNSLELNIRKVRVLTRSIDKRKEEKNIKEKSLHNPTNISNHNCNRISLKLIRKKSFDDINPSSLKGNEEKIGLEFLNEKIDKHYERDQNLPCKIVSPIMHMPSNITKTKVLPSIINKKTSYANIRNSQNMNNGNHNNSGNSSNNNMMGNGNENEKERDNEIISLNNQSPNKVKASLLKRIKYNENFSNRNSINGMSLKNIEANNNISLNHQLTDERDLKDTNEIMNNSNGLKLDISPQAKKIDKNIVMHNNSNMKVYLYIVKPGNNPDMIRRCFAHRLNWKESGNLFTTAYNYKWGQNKKSMEFCLLNKKNINKKIVNHFEFEPEISNKKYMFANILEYCDKNNLNAFEYLPFTIIAKINSNNFKENFKNFSEIFKNIPKYLENSSGNSNKKKEIYGDYFKNEINDYKAVNTDIKIANTHYTGNNLWLVKPTDLCGGRCIQISDNIDELEKFIKKFFDGMERSLKVKEEEEEDSLDEEDMNDEDKGKKGVVGVKYRASTVLIQKYIESPLLYYGRKFDLRIWVLITHKLDVYLFKEGHLKTTSIEYTTDSKDKFIHITNYSLQKYNNNFNKYEEGNELSFKDFQDFLDKEHHDFKINVKEVFYPQMIEIIKHSTIAIKDKLNKKKRQYCYVTLGYDFMIDSDLKVWLIEINKNPGLCESSNVIKVLVPRMIDDSLRLTLDEVFEPKFANNDRLNYKSPFHVEGYDDNENMWEYLHTLYPLESPSGNIK